MTQLVRLLALLAATAFTAPTFAQDAPPTAGKPQAPAAPPGSGTAAGGAPGGAPAPEATHPLAMNLAGKGSFACVARADQLAKFLDPASQSRALVQVPASEPNNRLLMATLVLAAPQQQVAIAGVNLAPNQANGCGGSYHVVSYAEGSCKDAAAVRFPGIEFKKVEPFDVSIGVIGRNAWVVAMPAGRHGCIFQKEEVAP